MGFLLPQESFYVIKLMVILLFSVMILKETDLSLPPTSKTHIPIFYAIRPNGIYFSSHELVLAKFLNAEIDPHGFAQADSSG